MNHQYQSLFVGYKTLEEWLLSVDKARPVFSSLVTDVGRQKQSGMRTDQIAIVVSQAEEGLVHYCRLPVARLRYMNGQPFDSDHERRIELARAALKIVEDWLSESGLQVAHAVIATPKDMLFLDGWAGFLEFDQTKQEYIRTDDKKQKPRRKKSVVK